MQYKAHSTVQILRMANLAPSHIELAVLRLGFMQRMLRHPTEHAQVLTVFYHPKLRFEQDDASHSVPGKVFPKHPWAIQLHGDISLWEVLDDGHELVTAVGKRVDKLFFNDDIKHMFLAVDVSRLRVYHVTSNVPPPLPYNQFDVPVVDEDFPDVDNIASDRVKFKCPDVTDTGEVCGQVFPSISSLQQHRRHSQLGGEHGQLSITSFVLRPQCCFCESVFASVAAAVQHVRNSCNRGYCLLDRSYMPSSLVDVDECSCPVCDEEFFDIKSYYAHIATHRNPPSVKCSQCKGLFANRVLHSTHRCVAKHGSPGHCTSPQVGNHGTGGSSEQRSGRGQQASDQQERP